MFGKPFVRPAEVGSTRSLPGATKIHLSVWDDRHSWALMSGHKLII